MMSVSLCRYQYVDINMSISICQYQYVNIIMSIAICQYDPSAWTPNSEEYQFQCASIAVQSLLCNHCYAIIVVQTLLCNHRCATIVVQKSHRCVPQIASEQKLSLCTSNALGRKVNYRCVPQIAFWKFKTSKNWRFWGLGSQLGSQRQPDSAEILSLA